MAHIRLLSRNFRSHVRLGSQNGVQETRTVATLNRSSEAEISDFSIKFTVKQDILGFQITMASSLGVNQVKRLKHLTEVEAANSGAKLLKSDKVEELTARDKLKSNVMDFLLCTIVGNLDGVFFVFVNIDDIGVLDVLDRFDFVAEELHSR